MAIKIRLEAIPDASGEITQEAAEIKKLMIKTMARN